MCWWWDWWLWRLKLLVVWNFVLVCSWMIVVYWVYRMWCWVRRRFFLWVCWCLVWLRIWCWWWWWWVGLCCVVYKWWWCFIMIGWLNGLCGWSCCWVRLVWRCVWYVWVVWWWIVLLCRLVELIVWKLFISFFSCWFRWSWWVESLYVWVVR